MCQNREDKAHEDSNYSPRRKQNVAPHFELRGAQGIYAATNEVGRRSKESVNYWKPCTCSKSQCGTNMSYNVSFRHGL